jgi:hypothetical protein
LLGQPYWDNRHVGMVAYTTGLIKTVNQNRYPRLKKQCNAIIGQGATNVGRFYTELTLRVVFLGGDS